MSNIQQRTTRFKLNTGAEIPAIGFGTVLEKEIQEPAILAALRAGYRHIDTARIYGTELAVGRALQKSGIPRDQIFITTKLWNNAHYPGDVGSALDASLQDLGVDYVDLFLMHWPCPFARGEDPFPQENGRIKAGSTDYVDTYRAMEDCFKSGKAKAIGVSNFSRAELQHLIDSGCLIPAVHQVELHPWLQQKSFMEWHQSKGIHVTQYSPLGNQSDLYPDTGELKKLIEDPILVKIGRTYQKSAAQVALAWGINHGRSVIPRTKSEPRMMMNLEADFKINPDDMQGIDSIDKRLRLNDPSKPWGWNFFADLDGKNLTV